jgi:alkylation response protein AidB-like acyl-CoA dehydrogenase
MSMHSSEFSALTYATLAHFGDRWTQFGPYPRYHAFHAIGSDVGYSAEYEDERMHRDAHGWAIAGGTPAIQRTRIAAEYIGRRFDQRA